MPTLQASPYSKARRIGGLVAQTLGLAALASLAIPGAARAQSDGWTPNDDDSLLFELKAGNFRLGDGVRGYQTPTGVCVDLGDMIMALDVPIRLDKKSRRATGWVFAETETLTIDREAGTVQTMNKKASLPQSAIVDAPEGWCVDSKMLSAWMGVTFRPDMSNATLFLETDRKLPFMAALERRARAQSVKPSESFDLSTLPQSRTPYEMWRTPSFDGVASMAVRNEAGKPVSVVTRFELFAAGEIAGASFDARLASDANGVPESLRVRAYRADPQGGLLGPLAATQIAVGDVFSMTTPLVAQNTAGRGAFITNRPLDMPASFDRTSFRGDLPDGWDAELYRNGALIAFSQSRDDGRYEFVDVQLFYGRNDFEVVLYGPQGQVRRERRVMPVGSGSIPARKTYYWAGAIQNGHDLIRLGQGPPGEDRSDHGWHLALGLERGLDKRTSAALSLHSMILDRRRRSYAEAALRRALGPALVEVALASQVSGGKGQALRLQALGQFGDANIGLESVWVQGSFQSDQVDRDLRARHALTLNHGFKLGDEFIPVTVEARHSNFDSGASVTELMTRLSFNIKGLNVTTELNWNKSTLLKDDRLDAIVRGNLRLGEVRLRGETRYRIKPDPKFDSAALVADWKMSDRSSLRGELAYDVDQDRVRLGMGYVRQFDQFALSGSAEMASDGSVAAGLNLAFSFGPDPRDGHMRFSNEKLAANGQAMALVFHDRNNDGVRQADEPGAADVALTAGQAVSDMVTDARGLAVVDGLRPFQPVMIGIDADSLSDPLVQPALPGRVVTPRPGVAARIELPLVSAGEVEGTLLNANGDDLGGVDLELLDARGAVMARTRSEFDGFFLFDRVPYGRYRLRINPLAASAVRAREALKDDVVLDGHAPIVRLGPMRLSPLSVMAQTRP